MEAQVNYFTCTLGQADRLRGHPESCMGFFDNAIDLVDYQAQHVPRRTAVGFANFKSGNGPSQESITFAQLRELSVQAANKIQQLTTSAKPSIGLLSTGKIDFIVTWLGLVRLGYSVLFLAPQLDIRAIRHLCTTLDIVTIFVDDIHASKVSDLQGSHEILRVPSLKYERRGTAEPLVSGGSLSDIAYFCHTSGTSSGAPKPMPQTHAGVVAAVPRLPGLDKPATFSTTPLYHGGLPDCFRAWTSGASIWFFPEGVVPITATNICSAMHYVQQENVRYFSSVPFVLQMLVEVEEGIELLRKMDLVGVGGAPLAAATGDRLVRKGVKLLSRMGSAECGFLMSSHRSYSDDPDWQFLRPLRDSRLLSFEPRENGLSELVMRPGWPFRAKVNREDGSYATSDLFEPHPAVPYAWKYHSRADAQITLVNGKKFDPSPIEAAILAATDVLRDVLVFGSGKGYPGIILFPRDELVSEEMVVETVWPHIYDMNDKSQSHVRISKPMLKVITLPSDEPALDKSSKGTILRLPAEKKYAATIEAAYTVFDGPTSVPVVADQDLEQVVKDCFRSVLGYDIAPHQDIFQQGVDSIACLQLRKLLHAKLSIPKAERLPMNIIYDHGTVDNLISYLKHTDDQRLNKDTDATHRLMRNLSMKYSAFDRPLVVESSAPRRAVVLTGATGFLGAHILYFLRRNHGVDHTYCLVRSRSREEAHARVSAALMRAGLPELGSFESSDKVLCLPSNMREENLGLVEHDVNLIKETASVFIHAAWSVNFALRLDSFEDQLSGTHSMIQLAMDSRARFVFVSSTAAVIRAKGTTVEEVVSQSPGDASSLGYAQSKWVAEQICATASNFGGTEENERLKGLPMAIVRVGQLCCNQLGIWSTSEAYPLLLSTAKIAGCLPDLPDESLNWIPVELAAQSVLDIALQDPDPENFEDGQIWEESPVYHIVNNSRAPSWRQMLNWIRSLDLGVSFNIVEPRKWMMQLEKGLSNHPNHSSQALLGMWTKRYCGDECQPPDGARFSTKRAERASPTIRGLQAVNRERVEKLWEWVGRTM